MNVQADLVSWFQAAKAEANAANDLATEGWARALHGLAELTLSAVDAPADATISTAVNDGRSTGRQDCDHGAQPKHPCYGKNRKQLLRLHCFTLVAQMQS